MRGGGQEAQKIVPLDERSRAPGGNGGNGRDIVSFRLNELERRVGTVEEKVDTIKDICTRMEAKMESFATKSYVLWYMGTAILLVILSLVGHILIRAI